MIASIATPPPTSPNYQVQALPFHASAITSGGNGMFVDRGGQLHFPPIDTTAALKDLSSSASSCHNVNGFQQSVEPLNIHNQFLKPVNQLQPLQPSSGVFDLQFGLQDPSAQNEFLSSDGNSIFIPQLFSISAYTSPPVPYSEEQFVSLEGYQHGANQCHSSSQLFASNPCDTQLPAQFLPEGSDYLQQPQQSSLLVLAPAPKTISDGLSENDNSKCNRRKNRLQRRAREKGTAPKASRKLLNNVDAKPLLSENPAIPLTDANPTLLESYKQQKRLEDALRAEERIRISLAESIQQCSVCSQPINDKFVLAVEDLLFHPGCLRCSVCTRGLDGSPTCFFRERTPYCRSCYSTKFRPTACSSCDRTIQSADWIRRARNSLYHLACFACEHCKRQLSTGEQFSLQDNRLLCKQHYMELIQGDGGHSKQKTKRVRTTFAEDQIEVLQMYFSKDCNPDGADLEKIANMTGLSKRVTQVWFQNSRARQKKYAGSSKRRNADGGDGRSESVSMSCETGGNGSLATNSANSGRSSSMSLNEENEMKLKLLGSPIKS